MSQSVTWIPACAGMTALLKKMPHKHSLNDMTRIVVIFYQAQPY